MMIMPKSRKIGPRAAQEQPNIDEDGSDDENDDPDEDNADDEDEQRL